MTIGANLSLRITAILLAGFVILQLVVFTAMTLPGHGSAERAYNLPSPAQIAAVADTLDAAPPKRRILLVETLDASLYTVEIAPTLPGLQQVRDVQGVAIAASYRTAMPNRSVLFWARPAMLGRINRETAWPGRFLAPATLAISLRSGGALVLRSHPSTVVRAFLRERAALGALGGLAVLVALTLAVRQTTRPITRLAENIRTFSDRLDAPDLPEDGSRELRELAIAFNVMKRRIAGLITERTRILAGIAHDMRTYLTRLRLRAEFIDDADQRDHAARDLAEMSMLLDDTLLYAQPGTVATMLEPIDLSAEIAATVTLRQEMGEAVTLTGPLVATIVRADRLALRRILANLIENGLRHGTHVVLGMQVDAHAVRIIVTDDGPGVPPDQIDRMGAPFERLDPSRDRSTGGAGLGLAIVRALADRQGASVSFTNSPGSGLSATLSFPAGAAAT